MMPTSSLSYSSLKVLVIWYSGSDKMDSWDARSISGSQDDSASSILFSVNSEEVTHMSHKTTGTSLHFILSQNLTSIIGQKTGRHTKSAQIRKISQPCLVAFATGTVSDKIWMSLTSKTQTSKTSLILNSVGILRKSKSIFTAFIC